MRGLLPPRHERRRADVSLAIINIVLLLIFFFLATGALVNAPEFGIEVSETLDLPIDRLPQPILIIRPDGGLLLNGDPIDPEALGPTLAAEPVLHVLIERTAPAQDLLQVLAEPGLRGIDIELVTIHRSSTP